MLDIFKQVKEYVTPRQVVEYFIGAPVKTTGGSSWYCSPFRNERTASFCVNDDKGIHDFGDSNHYDVISFTAKYNNCSPKDACKLLISTFNLPIAETKIISKELAIEIRKKEQEREQKRISQTWYQEQYSKLCDKYISQNKAIDWETACAKDFIIIDKLEYLIDFMRKEKAEDIYNTKMKEVIEEYAKD